MGQTTDPLRQAGDSLRLSAGFNIYVRKNMYNIEDYFKQNKVYRFYNMLGENYIDPQKQGGINEESINKGLNRLYPDTSATGYLIIDIENKVVKDFRDYPLNDPRFLDADFRLKELVSLVKRSRPNLKISLYGLPSRVFYPNQNKWNDDKKLDQILSLCDFIAPSLYILYPDKEKGTEVNESYIKQNLKTALDYGKRLDKPVIPFIWYAVSPGNKLYGGEVLDKQEVVHQVELVRDFEWGGTKSAGVIWWEPSENAFQKIIKLTQSVQEKSQITKDKNIIIRQYTQPFLTKK